VNSLRIGINIYILTAVLGLVMKSPSWHKYFTAFVTKLNDYENHSALQ